MTVDDPSHLDELIVDLRALGDVSMERNRGIVALVGAGLSESSAAMARALAALGEIRVYMVSLNASGINLTLLVDGEQVAPVLQRLHKEFFETAQ
jgi:aspartate kinase